MPKAKSVRRGRKEDGWCVWDEKLGWLWYSMSGDKETSENKIQECGVVGRAFPVRVAEILPNKTKRKGRK